MYKTSESLDGKNRAGAYKVKFQGSYLRNCAELIFWFRWKHYTFDIREIRVYFGKKNIKRSLELNTKLHRCAIFHKQMQEVIDLVGERDFEEILLELDQ